nr:hypothetical protein GCM10020241_34960 [Streptoalloteichus tenebrarius]
MLRRRERGVLAEDARDVRDADHLEQVLLGARHLVDVGPVRLRPLETRAGRGPANAFARADAWAAWARCAVPPAVIRSHDRTDVTVIVSTAPTNAPIITRRVLVVRRPTGGRSLRGAICSMMPGGGSRDVHLGDIGCFCRSILRRTCDLGTVRSGSG